MTNPKDRKQQTAQLKQVREAHPETVESTQSHLKEQQAIRKTLRQALKDGPLTVPELAAAVEMPSDVVLWHVTAMKKYGLVVEAGFDGEYYQYDLAKEKSA